MLGRGGFDLHEVRPLLESELRSDDIGSVVDSAFTREIGLVEASIGVHAVGHHSDHQGYGRLHLWRDPKWSRFDPVVAYLENFADCQVVESISEFRSLGGRRIAIAQPGTSEWQAMEPDASILILHTEALPEGTPRPALSTVKLPICMRDLAQRMDRFFQ